MSNKPIWSGFLKFSLTERRALFLLILLLSILKLLPFLLESKSSQVVFTEEEWIAFQQSLETQQRDTIGSEVETFEPTIRYTSFDPNKITARQLGEWNVPDRVISTWMNYRNAGGQFKTASDLRKIYGLSEELANTLIPYVRIQVSERKPLPVETEVLEPSTKPKDPPEQVALTTTNKEVTLSIDINQSNLEDWVALPGIGQAYAGRILRFREALGGFSSTHQVGETWHLPDSVFQVVLPYLKASPPFRTLLINEAQEEDLAKHPYINNKQARVIIRFRENYGGIDSPEMLLQTGVLSETDIELLMPYLRF